MSVDAKVYQITRAEALIVAGVAGQFDDEAMVAALMAEKEKLGWFPDWEEVEFSDFNHFDGRCLRRCRLRCFWHEPIEGVS